MTGIKTQWLHSYPTERGICIEIRNTDGVLADVVLAPQEGLNIAHQVSTQCTEAALRQLVKREYDTDQPTEWR